VDGIIPTRPRFKETRVRYEGGTWLSNSGKSNEILKPRRGFAQARQASTKGEISFYWSRPNRWHPIMTPPPLQLMLPWAPRWVHRSCGRCRCCFPHDVCHAVSSFRRSIGGIGWAAMVGTKSIFRDMAADEDCRKIPARSQSRRGYDRFPVRTEPKARWLCCGSPRKFEKQRRFRGNDSAPKLVLDSGWSACLNGLRVLCRLAGCQAGVTTRRRGQQGTRSPRRRE